MCVWETVTFPEVGAGCFLARYALRRPRCPDAEQRDISRSAQPSLPSTAVASARVPYVPRRTRPFQALCLVLVAGGAHADTVRGEEVCIVVRRPVGSRPTERIFQAIRSTWAAGNNTFVWQPGSWPEHWPDTAELPVGLGVWWRSLGERLPKRCSWVLAVPPDSYVNVPKVAARLRCLYTDPDINYLGVPKIVALGGGTVMRVADGDAGIVVKTTLLRQLPMLLDRCVSRPDFRSTFTPNGQKFEDVALGACLWIHNVQLHTWLDPGDEVFYNSAVTVAAPYGFAADRTRSPYAKTIDKHGDGPNFGTLQCIFLVLGVSASEVMQLDALVAKSGRWFKNIACVSAGLTLPELTKAWSVVNGETMTEPIFSPAVRQALQQCFLAAAFTAFGRNPVLPTAGGANNIDTPAALAREWRDPALGVGPAVARLKRGGHAVCVFVVCTRATEQHLRDAESVLQSWGTRNASEGVEVFLVGRQLWGDKEAPAAADAALELRGDVDLGFLYNTVRVLYLWRYLSAHHVEDCEWFVKADADTFINPWALKERLLRYFDSAKQHYLGTMKNTRLGSGRLLPFAYNVAILSRALLREAADWFPICVDDLVRRKLGKGAEDIDLAYCLDLHGGVAPSRLGATQEVYSRAMLRATQSDSTVQAVSIEPPVEHMGVDGQDGKGMLTESGACTLFVHPVHADEMLTMHAELLRLRATLSAPIPANVTYNASAPLVAAVHGAPFSRFGGSCDWPAVQEKNTSRWQRYMQQEYHGEANCWMGQFNWLTCCDQRVWGSGGHSICWDEEYTFERCCGQARLPVITENLTVNAIEEVQPAPSQKVMSVGIADANGEASSQGGNDGAMVAKGSSSAAVAGLRAGSPDATMRTATQIKPFSRLQSARGNPKCWAHSGFSYEQCCDVDESNKEQFRFSLQCWAWPYTPGFCCHPPLPPRPPVQVGGVRGAQEGERKRTARCPGEYEKEYLACSKSLDEIGALFEVAVIGTGDKASGWHDYLGAYERFLLHLPLSANVLEFGVRLGSSLAMWSEYFPMGTVVGIDKKINTFLQRRQAMERDHGAFSNRNVHVIEGNATDASIIPELKAAGFGEDFADVIVDDANHWPIPQLARFELFFPRMLRSGGVYIIEDVHIQAPYSHDGKKVRDYFFKLSDAAYLNEGEILVGAHHIDKVRRQSEDWRHQVESVSLLRDMVVVTKASI